MKVVCGNAGLSNGDEKARVFLWIKHQTSIKHHSQLPSHMKTMNELKVGLVHVMFIIVILCTFSVYNCSRIYMSISIITYVHKFSVLVLIRGVVTHASVLNLHRPFTCCSESGELSWSLLVRGALWEYGSVLWAWIASMCLGGQPGLITSPFKFWRAFRMKCANLVVQ